MTLPRATLQVHTADLAAPLSIAACFARENSASKAQLRPTLSKVATFTNATLNKAATFKNVIMASGPTKPEAKPGLESLPGNRGQCNHAA